MSCMIMVSAAVKLMPSPPALVDNKNTKIFGSRVNWSIRSCLSVTIVWPSKRKNEWWRNSKYRSNISNIMVNWLKISTRWPSCFNCGNSTSNRLNLPDSRNRWSGMGKPTTSCNHINVMNWNVSLTNSIYNYDIHTYFSIVCMSWKSDRYAKSSNTYCGLRFFLYAGWTAILAAIWCTFSSVK